MKNKNENIKQKQKQNTSTTSNASDLNKELNKSTDMISSLIHEYLLKKDYNKTLDSFQEEVTQKIKTNLYYKPYFQEINETSVLKSFTLGNKIEFFKQWNRLIPSHIKLKETAYSKLEFFIEIYFAIFPLLGDKKMTPQIQKELKNNMEDFKKYLETKEIELSKTTEFLAYYALPYVPNPKEHPSYQSLFSPEWTKELKEKIKQCIKNYLPSLKYPVLYDLVSGSDEDQGKIEAMRAYLESLSLENVNVNANEDNGKLIEEYKKLKAKEEKSKIAFVDSQKTWTNLALNIISYSFDLISFIKKNNIENSPQIEKINKKLNKYQIFLKKNIEELEKNKNNSNNSNLLIKREDIETIQNSKYEDSIANQPTIEQIQPPINQSLQQQDTIIERKSIQIDYEPSHLIDMKKFVTSLSKRTEQENKQWYIFREIRVRIFRRSDITLKQLTLYSIFYYDLFGTYSKSSNMIHYLLSNEILNLEVMKLLNSIASLSKGRNYLLAKDTLIDDIVQCMIREKGDTDLRQNCLGTIQKFTLRTTPQNRLIELNVIHYIVDVFTYESNSLSEYSMEYGLALIMNLSLRKEGREKFEAVSERIMQILLNFMKKDNLQILTCINGTLYSLLKRKKFKIEAQKYNLVNVLTNFNTNNPQLKKQISYILEELSNPPEEEEYIENFDEDINAKDDDELAYDEYSDVDSIDETLLEEHYKVLGEYIIRNEEINKNEEQILRKFMNNNPNMSANVNKSTINSISASLRPQDVDRPLRRPTTPLTNLSMTGNSQMFGGDKKNSQIKSINSHNVLQSDTAKAFLTRDLVERTLPKDLNVK